MFEEILDGSLMYQSGLNYNQGNDFDNVNGYGRYTSVDIDKGDGEGDGIFGRNGNGKGLIFNV